MNNGTRQLRRRHLVFAQNTLSIVMERDRSSIPTNAGWIFTLLIICLTPGLSSAAPCDVTGLDFIVAPGDACELDPGTYNFATAIIQGKVTALTDVTSGSYVTLMASDYVKVQQGGSITSDFLGHLNREGPGAGISRNSKGSGGSHGGRGGTTRNSFLEIGDAPPYGSVVAPLSLGSGGGLAGGGIGGGVIHIVANVSVTIDGDVTADGEDASGNGGGGSGGSIFIETDFFGGGGRISARGGNAANHAGGGGGGGRITVNHRDSTYTGQLFAYGGLNGAMAATRTPQSVSSSGQGYTGANEYGDLETYPSSNKAWRPYYFNTGQWLTLTLEEPMHVVAIETRGSPDQNYYVTGYAMQYLNATSGEWEFYQDRPVDASEKLFTGNTNDNGKVIQTLDYPVLTGQIKLLPRTWSGGIGLAFRVYAYENLATDETFPGRQCEENADSGEPGGPGTIFFNGRGFWVGKILVDNMGRQPYIATQEDCERYDPVRSGAVAWIMDKSSDIDLLVVINGGHALIQVDIEKSVIEGDDTAVLHVDSGHTLTIGDQLAAKTVIEENSIIAIPYDVDLTITKPTIVYGTFESLDDEDSNVYIEDVFKIRPQVMNISGLTVRPTGNFTTTNDDSPLILAVKTLNLEGNFSAAELKAIGWEKFVIGPEGIVTFDPVDHDEYFGPDISIQGDLTLLKTISITLPCDKFEIDGGSLVMVGTETIRIECLNVTINGLFEPEGLLDVGEGLPTFHVGPLGQFVFNLSGDFIADDVDINGVMTSMMPIVMRGRVRDNINRFNIGEYGELTLDPYSQDLHNWTGISKIGAHAVSIHGRLKGGLLSITDVGVNGGWDYLFIKKSGLMEFDPAGNFLCDVMEIDGHFESYAPLFVKAHKDILDLVLLVGPYGYVHLDSNDHHPNGPWTNISVIRGQYFLIEGPDSLVQLGDTNIAVETISIGGQLTVDPSYPIKADSFEVNETGHMETPRPINIRGLSDDRVVSLTLSGYVKLDMLADHSLRNWSTAEGSIFNADNVLVGSAGDLHLGLLTEGLRWELFSQNKGANMEFEPLDRFLITDSIIGGRVKSLIPMSTGKHLEGTTLNVLATGTFDLDFRGPPNTTDSGCLSSYIKMEEVAISGTVQAGSLELETTSMDVSDGGVLDVSGGGYESENGPGAGIRHSSGGSGASHGGRGGKSPYVYAQNMPHCHLYVRCFWGSGGGSTGDATPGGRGGGFLHIDVQQDFVMDGEMCADANDAPTTNTGGGSAGSIWIKADLFKGRGYMYINGGTSSGSGGGGAGGRINIFYRTGDFLTGHIQSKGGASNSSGEVGGPGVLYMEGTSPSFKNLRVDNLCQQPIVTVPKGVKANQDDFNLLLETGAIAYVVPPNDHFEFKFTLVEVYGAAHLAFLGNGTQIETEFVYGDDTGYVYIAPYQTIALTEVSPFKRVNMTWNPLVFEKANLILPTATVEFRPSLDQMGKGMPGPACPEITLFGTKPKIWGNLIGDKAHLLVGNGKVEEYASTDSLSLCGLKCWWTLVDSPRYPSGPIRNAFILG